MGGLICEAPLCIVSDISLGVITLCGLPTEVSKLESRLKETIKQQRDRAANDSMRKIRSQGITTAGGRQDLLELAEEPVTIPAHWTKYTGGIAESIKTFLRMNRRGCRVDVDTKHFQAVKKLVEGSWRYGVVGQGQDAKNLNHQNIQVIKVQRIENPNVWHDYSSKKKKLLANAAWTGCIESLQQHKEKAILTTTLGISELDRLLISEINEVFLFHGTTMDNAESIVNQGTDSRLGKQTGMFGKGIYFAESSTKADQYTGKTKSTSILQILSDFTIEKKFI